MNELWKIVQISIFCFMTYVCMSKGYQVATVAFLLLIWLVLIQYQIAIRYKKIVENSLSRFGLEKIKCDDCGRISCRASVSVIQKNECSSVDELSMKVYKFTGIVTIITLKKENDENDEN